MHRLGFSYVYERAIRGFVHFKNLLVLPPSPKKNHLMGYRLLLVIVGDNKVAIHAMAVVLGF